jgi:hypothetical protein
MKACITSPLPFSQIDFTLNISKTEICFRQRLLTFHGYTAGYFMLLMTYFKANASNGLEKL